jgi:hypothetical protein
MKAVSIFLVRGLSAAAISYTTMKLTYGSAEYAAVGPLSISVDTLLKAVPGFFGVIVPVIAQKWPAVASLVNLALAIVRYRSPEAASLLGKVSALEVHAMQTGDEKTQAACATIRDQILKSVK